MAGPNTLSVHRQQHHSGIHSETGKNKILDSAHQDPRTVPVTGSTSHTSHPNTSSGISQYDSGHLIQTQQSQSDSMENTTRDLKQSILCLRDPQVDMFATASNKVAPIFVSPFPGEAAWAVDALSISSDNLGLVYMFPPAR